MSKFLIHDEVKYEHLLGREFVFGTQDCYTLGQQAFADNTSVVLPDYARPTDFWLGVEELYLNNFANEGFKQMNDLQLTEMIPMDVFLIAIPDPRVKHGKLITNHCAIYVGGGYVIHHRLGRLSEKVLYRGWLREYTTHILRHKNAVKNEAKPKPFDILDRLLPHKRAQVEEAIRNGLPADFKT